MAKESIGLRSYFGLMANSANLKRESLLFNKIGVFQVNSHASYIQRRSIPEIYWLIEQGIVYDPVKNAEGVKDSWKPEDLKLLDNHLKFLDVALDPEKAAEQFPQFNIPRFETEEEIGNYQLIMFSSSFGEVILRPLSNYLRDNDQIDTVPLPYLNFDLLPSTGTSKESVVQIVLKALPLPDDSVSWEQIIDFRNDPDSFGKFLAIRSWMSDVAKSNLSPIEIEQKIEWLLHEYQHHMKVHKMKVSASALETVIVSVAEFTENLVKLNFGKAAKALFAIKNKKVQLLEAELKAPGREIALISKANETFKKRK
jgi:hypothetical protein